MKIRVYKKKLSNGPIYIMTGDQSGYSKLHDESRFSFKFRTAHLPKSVVKAISECSLLEQNRIGKIIYKGSK